MTLPIGEPRTAGRRVVRRRFVPHNVGRMKVALPNGLTLGNLFFGINAIIAASRGNFNHACLFVVLGGVCDAFDGAAARATRTGGRFGEELDSLVDAISFGLAPAMIVHFSTLANNGSGWNLAVFTFAACAVMRLARFNVTQAGEKKSYFQGLPSPAAGGTVATYYWFSQTPFYQDNAAIVGLPWGTVMQVLMIVLGFLMVSSVPYPAWPKVGIRSLKGILGLAAILFILFGIGFWRRAFFFPFGIAYVGWGLLRAAGLGLWERRPRRDDGVDAYGVARPPRLARRSTPHGMPAVGSMDEAEALGLIDTDPDELLDDDTDYFDDADEPAPARVRPGRPEREERAGGGERRSRRERAESGDRRERGARGDRTDRADRAERTERPARPDRPPRPERTEGTAPAADAAGERPEGAARKRRKRRKTRPAGGEGGAGGATNGRNASNGGDGGDGGEPLAPPAVSPNIAPAPRAAAPEPSGGERPPAPPTSNQVAPE